MTIIRTDFDMPGLTLFKKGKVRNVYDLGETLLFVASDRVSAFDYILPNGIPDKGRILTAVSVFWFNHLKGMMPTHFISDQVSEFPEETHPYREMLEGRSMWVKKTKLIEIECVVRGYLAGSGWKEYQQSGMVCGHSLPAGLKQASKLPQPIFTPAIKAESGHDENISIAQMEEILGKELSQILIEKSVALYQMGHDHMAKRGVILADTKFEFGVLDDQVILIDEVMTPDSSRYWPVEGYQEGISPPSYDKQIIRDHLEATWDKEPPVPMLPEAVLSKTCDKYEELLQILIA